MAEKPKKHCRGTETCVEADVCLAMADDSNLSRIAQWLKVKVPEACPDCDEPDVLAEVRALPNMSCLIVRETAQVRAV
jgi:hypothetical protein